MTYEVKGVNMFNFQKAEKIILLVFLVAIVIYGFKFKASLEETKAIGVKTNLAFTIVPSIVEKDLFCIKLSDYKRSLYLKRSVDKSNVTVSVTKVNECIKEVFVNNESVIFQDNDCIDLNRIRIHSVGGKAQIYVYDYCL